MSRIFRVAFRVMSPASAAGPFTSIRLAGLAAEPGGDGRVPRRRRRQDFDGDDGAEVVDRLVDPGHAALAEAAQDLVLAEEEVVGEAAEQDGGLVLRDVLVGDQPAGELV